jgi:hypothetical protein
MQLNFFSIKAMKIHNIMTFILLLTMTFQGFLINLRIADQPLWAILLLLFIPFIPNYLRLFIRLSWQIKLIYFCLLLTVILISITALFVNGGIARLNYDRLLVPLIGIYISTIFLYSYRDKVNLLIKQISIVMVIMAFFFYNSILL